jgi:hypothetical protein
MEGKVILIAGRKKTGKTTLLLSLIKNVNPDALRVHDISGKCLEQLNYKKPQLSYVDFKKECTSLENAVFIFEEATVFIRHSPDEDLLNFLVTARHRGNTSIFIFHSLRSIPHYIWNQSDYLYLLKTSDDESIVNQKFHNEELTELFNRVKASPDPHAKILYEIL